MSPAFAEKKYTPPEPHDSQERKEIIRTIPIKSSKAILEKASVKLESLLFGTKDGKPMPNPPQKIELRLRMDNEVALKRFIEAKFEGVKAEIIPVRAGEKFPVLLLTRTGAGKQAAQYVPKTPVSIPAQAPKIAAEKPKPAKIPSRESSEISYLIQAKPAPSGRETAIRMPVLGSLFHNVTEANYYQRLELLKKSSTFENLSSMVAEMQTFKPMTPAENMFMRHALDYTLSFKKAMQTQDDFEHQGDRLIRKALKLGKYIVGKRDCYTFAMDELNKALEQPGRFHNTRSPPKVAYQGLEPKGELMFRGVGNVFLAVRTYKKGQPLTFPPGADIFVPSGSPFGTHHDHHGVVASDGQIIHRGSDGLRKDDLNWFVRNASTIKVSVPNDVHYAEVYSAVPIVKQGRKTEFVRYDVAKVARQQ